MEYYIDRAGVLGDVERTPQGGIRVPAKLARVGIMPYPAGSLRRQGLDVPAHFRDTDIVKIHLPGEVLQAAVASVDDSPVTREHPPEFLSPANFQTYARGSVSGGSASFDGEYLHGRLAIQDAQLITDIDVGERREVSMGYMATTRFEDGEFNGQPYHAVRVAIQYNHTAVVAKGRAGEQVCLALDSAEIPTETTMITVNDTQLEGEAAQAAVDGLVSQLATQAAEVARLQAELTAAAAATAAADSDEAFQVKLAAFQAAEAAKVAKAERLGRAKAGYPALAATLDSASDDYVAGLLAALGAGDPEGLSALQDKSTSVAAPVADAPAPEAPKARKLSVREREMAKLKAVGKK